MSTSTAGPVACEPRTAFVLAGGAALGAMQAGMVHALYERGIGPDLLIGTSAGALNAAFLASRPPTVATAEQLAALWRGLRRTDVLPLRPATLLGGLAGRRDHLIPDQALRRLATRHLQFERLEQAAIPLHLVAFDLLTGTEVRLSDGLAVDAVLAAAAIPGVLPPVRWRGRLLVDGGIADNTPVSHAVALGARRIYVLPTQNPGDRGLPRPPRAALAAAVHAITVLTNARLHGDLARYAPSAELIVLPAANPGHIPPTDFGHAGQLITQALAAARTALTVRSARPADGGHSPRRDVARPDRAARRPLWRRPRARPGAFRATAARVQAPARLLRRRGWRRVARLAAIAAIEEFRQTGDAAAGHGRAPSARPMADIGHAGIPERIRDAPDALGDARRAGTGLIPIDGGHRRRQP
jgi:NTE family protein